MNEQLKAKLLKLLGLADAATEADMESALDAAIAQGDKDAKAVALSASVEAATAKLSDLQVAMEAVIARGASAQQGERAAILSAAAAEGKVVPPELAGLPTEQLKVLTASLPVTVPMQRKAQAATTHNAAPDAEQQEIDRVCGL